ncbi:MAG: pantetheine-phosphate adenylyltransferase [Oscillospiraceae bacterium]|jgi:pantetheine-phosphate adenylyltransferase|nr:pantetheine-phosphate adenylyltransferase [Oscillospiraceae bacterium]
MKKAICPGSFDPVTNGHLDIIRRAAAMFDELIVLVSCNAAKRCLFTPAERIELIQGCVGDLPNVRVDSTDGLIAQYAADHSATGIVKGLRALSDFDYEFQQALTNKVLNPEIETVFLAASSDSMFLSSSMCKQVVALGGDCSRFVPPNALAALKAKLLPQP